MPHDNRELLARVEQLFESQRFGVLCTCRPSGAPYGSLVAVTAVDELRGVVFATLRTTRKFENLVQEPRVALLVDNRTNRETDLRDAIGVTVIGAAAEVTGEPRQALQAQGLARHPQMADFLSSADCALMRVAVATLSTVTRFQQVVEIHFADQAAEDPH